MTALYGAAFRAHNLNTPSSTPVDAIQYICGAAMGRPDVASVADPVYAQSCSD
jgi:hypothetical protein